MRKMIATPIWAALWFGWSTASAHHSNAPHYDRERPITIEGVVEEFEFVNPHAFLHIRAEDPEYFTEPFSGTNYYMPSLYPVSGYNCTLERSNR